MLHQLKLILILILFFPLGRQVAIGQEASSPPFNCAEFATKQGWCYTTLTTNVTIGGEWKTTSTVKNTSNIPEWFSWVVNPMTEKTDGWFNHLSIFIAIKNGEKVLSPTAGEMGSHLVAPGETLEITFIGPTAGCDAHGQNCDYGRMDPVSVVSGMLTTGWMVRTPEPLRTLPSAVVKVSNFKTEVVVTTTRQSALPSVVATVDGSDVTVRWKVPPPFPDGMFWVEEDGIPLWAQSLNEGSEIRWGASPGFRQYCIFVPKNWVKGEPLVCTWAMVP